MTKILSGSSIDFGAVDEFKSKKVSGTIENIGTERIVVSDLISSKDEFVVNFSKATLEPAFPASATIYVDKEGLIQNLEGAFYTSSQGFGCIGFTDSEGKLTIDPVPHDFIEVLGVDSESGLINVKYHDQNINLI